MLSRNGGLEKMTWSFWFPKKKKDLRGREGISHTLHVKMISRKWEEDSADFSGRITWFMVSGNFWGPKHDHHDVPHVIIHVIIIPMIHFYSCPKHHDVVDDEEVKRKRGGVEERKWIEWHLKNHVVLELRETRYILSDVFRWCLKFSTWWHATHEINDRSSYSS